MGESSEMPGTVVAALIWRQGKLLICQRRQTDAFPGKWEFPGGKMEAEESSDAALARELSEELAIRARIGARVATVEHQYPGRPPVRLLFFVVNEFEGDPQNLVFEQIRWALPQELPDYDFLEADRGLIERLARGEISPL